jgi:hypothetical protein
MPSVPSPSEPSRDRVQPRPTQEGLVVTGPQRWPWFDDQSERDRSD